METKKYSPRYGYICMTCGKSFANGVNADGECEECEREAEESREAWAEQISNYWKDTCGGIK